MKYREIDYEEERLINISEEHYEVFKRLVDGKATQIQTSRGKMEKHTKTEGNVNSL